MALPNIVGTGACGIAAIANSAWGPPTTDGGGYPVYLSSASAHQQGIPYLRWNPSLNAWVFDAASVSSGDTNTSFSQVYYYSNDGQTEASGPVGTYAAGGLGTAPAPVVTVNPQVVAGGPPVSLSFIASSSPQRQGYGVFTSSGQNVSSATVNSDAATPTAPASATQGGWTLTANSDYATGTVQAPASATPGTGYLAQIGESSGYGVATFDVVAASGMTLRGASFTDALVSDDLTRFGVSRAPVLFSDALLSDSSARSGMTRAAQSFSEALLSDSLAVVISAPRTRGGIFTDALLLDSYTFSPRSGAPQVFADALLSDYGLPQPVTHPSAAFADTLFADAFHPGPRTFGPQHFADALFSDAGGRTGAGSGGSGASPAFVFTDALFADRLVAGPRNGGPRTFADALFADSLTRTGYARSVSFADALFSDHFTAGLTSAAPLPEVPDSRDPFVVLAQELRLLLSFAKGNPMSQQATLQAIFDKLAAAYRINELSQTANTLAALPILIRGGDGVTSTVYGFGLDQPILALLPAAESMIAASAPNVIITSQYRGFLAALTQYLSSLGFRSLDAYLSGLNTSAPYQALVHPNLALVAFLFNGGQGTLLLSPGNVFAPQTAFGMAVAGPGAGGLAFTHLSAIPAANVVLPTPFLSTQGYTAAKGITASVTVAVSGTLAVTLTGTGQTAAGLPVSGRTWTAALDNAPAGAVISFVPAVAGDRIYDITACTGVGTAGAGAFTLSSVLERIVA